MAPADRSARRPAARRPTVRVRRQVRDALTPPTPLRLQPHPAAQAAGAGAKSSSSRGGGPWVHTTHSDEVEIRQPSAVRTSSVSAWPAETKRPPEPSARTWVLNWAPRAVARSPVHQVGDLGPVGQCAQLPLHLYGVHDRRLLPQARLRSRHLPHIRPYRARTSSPAMARRAASAPVAGTSSGAGRRVARTPSAVSARYQERPSVAWYSTTSGSCGQAYGPAQQVDRNSSNNGSGAPRRQRTAGGGCAMRTHLPPLAVVSPAEGVHDGESGGSRTK